MGSPIYKGIVEWEDNFDEEENANTFATSDTNVSRIFARLMGYATAGTLISLEIKRVNTD